MRKSYKFAKKKKSPLLRYHYNKGIRAPEVKVIDDEGNMLGIMPTYKAIELAQDRETDLVEVAPKAQPPVTKLMDYGKFQYQQEKQLKKQRNKVKKVETKGIRISTKISEHDLETRIKQARKFLQDEQKVKIEIILRGREHQHIDLAKEVINNFIKKLDTPYLIEQEISKQGSKIFTIIIPDKSN